MLDEVVGKNHLGEINVKCDWSNLKFTDNVDVLMAVNPQGIGFNERFEVIMPTNENTFAKRLVGKHRNDPSISALLDHYKALFEYNSYLESSSDLELEMPTDNIPVWIQKKYTITLQCIRIHKRYFCCLVQCDSSLPRVKISAH